MRRLTIFAKGNADVGGSLHVLHEDGVATWNGINAVLQQSHPTVRARVIHETMARSDALLAAVDRTPPDRMERALPLGAYPLPSQWSSRLFEVPADVVILSIQPDVMNRIVRHIGDGRLLYPHDLDAWPDVDRAWLIANYRPQPPLDPDRSLSNLKSIIDRLRRDRDPAILIFNMASVVPWERLHCYRGVGETLGNRIRRFNLALVDLSRATGISIVDVDAVLAREGTARLTLDAVALSRDGCRLVAEEVVRILDDLGLLGAS